MKLAEKLVYLRKKQGLSQLKLAEMMNVSRQAISRWETGIAVPSAENLKYLGNLYNVSLDYSPFSASVDFGLIAPNGRFYYLNSKDGSLNGAIEVDERGQYTLAIRNNSAETINVSGYVNY